MTGAPDWIGWEERIARLLPVEGSSPDRVRLLSELEKYATAAVRQARQAEVWRLGPEARDRTLEWLQRPVFICGHHRTGTTLLAQLLDGHPELVVLPSEGTYFTSFGYAARARPTRTDVDRFLADWIARFVDPNSEPYFKIGRTGPDGNPSVLFARRFLGWHPEIARARPKQARFAVLFSLIAAFKEMAATANVPRRWVEKTPLNECHVDKLAVLPEALFIQLVRDPAATLASLLHLLRASGLEADAARHAWRIGRSLERARKNTRGLSERYLVVRYEDLVSNPAVEMERVRTFLGISPNATLTRPTALGEWARANSSFGRGEPGVIHAPSGAPLLSSAESRLIRVFTAPAARALGYAVAPPAAMPRAAVLLHESARVASRYIRSQIRRSLGAS